MNVINRSPYRDEDGNITLNNRVSGTWRYGLTWNRETQAQDKLVNRMSVLLDNNYTLVRDVILPGLAIPIPLVLVGPTGVRVFYASMIRGIYRTKENSWSVMDSRSRHYRPSEPNLVRRTILMSQAIFKFLVDKGYHVQETEPVLFFADPDIHIDTFQSNVHILLTDGVDRYIEQIAQDQDTLDITEVKRILDTFEKISSIQETKSADNTLTIGSLKLYRWQWLVLGILGILQLCMLLIFIIIIFMLS